jgi:putative endopeptidase
MRQNSLAFMRASSFILLLSGATAWAGPPSNAPTWGIDVAGMDRNVKPGDDWYEFVNGTWQKHATIPANHLRLSAFTTLTDLSEGRVRRWLESHGTTDRLHPDRAKAAALYQGFMDESAAERLDAAPLTARLAPIRAAQDKQDIARLMGRSMGGFGASFFGASVVADLRRPDQYALSLRQSGLGLGDRGLYLDPKFQRQLDRYRQYVGQMLNMAAWPNADDAAAKVVQMETRIAQAQWTRAENRAVDKTYNPMTLADLKAQAPGFPWDIFWQSAGLLTAARAIVAQDTAFPKMAAVFADTDVDTLKAWEAFRAADQIAPLLSKRFVDAQFDFRNHFLLAQPQQTERWKRAKIFAEREMGEAIGRDYVARYFPPESRAKMEQLAANLVTAMRGRIRNLTWMSPATRQRALDKLEQLTVKIGYPSKWRDYSGLEIVPGDLVGNAERAARFGWDHRRNRIGDPVDKTEWAMTPQTVNAYFDAGTNEIIFPAAMLQPPFFDPAADPAVNYGGIGAMIAHEMSHGFDEEGRKFDAQGIAGDWWTAEDMARFRARAHRLAAQFDGYTFSDLPGMHVKGDQTSTEDVADLAGVVIALDAYHASLNGREAPVIGGFTGDQRFFLAWGQAWRTLQPPDLRRMLLVTDSHSPEEVRSVGPLRNIDAWYDAWGIQPGDRQYVAPEDRVRIW